MPYPASLIAYAFVKKGAEQNLPITQMKLQKLVFFAHGVYLALNNDTPLIQEEFEAWQFGPVVPKIYQEYKAFGNQPIKCSSPGLNDAVSKLDPSANTAIDYTWNVTKGLSAMTLSNWTHLKGSPWEEAYVPGYSSISIDNITIQKYFSDLLESAKNVRSQLTQA